MEYSYLFVVLMGMGVVFFGLICIIFLTWLMGVLMKNVKDKAPAPASAPAPAAKPQGMQPEIVAAITAVLSEEIGISANALNIVDIKKL